MREPELNQAGRTLGVKDLSKMFEGSQVLEETDSWNQQSLNPYPGFTLRDFSQRSEIEPDQRLMQYAEGWRREVLAFHEGKHKFVDHPWCTACLSRWLLASGAPELPPDRLDDVTFDRAVGYLQLHGRPPRDDLKAGSADRDLDSLFMGRSKLREAVSTTDPLIEGVLNRHSYALLRGRDASFKSFIALDWSLSLATGTKWKGARTDQVRVLYVAGEGFHGLESRIAAWESASGVKVSSDWFVVRGGGVNMFRAGHEYQHLLSHVESGQYGLVVLDTLRRMSGGAGENSSDMGVVVDNIVQIRDRTTDGCVLVVAHTGKSDEDVRGFSGIEDDSDIVWSVKRQRSSSYDVSLKCVKMKDGQDGHGFQLRMREQDQSLVVSHSDQPTGVMDAERLSVGEARVMQAMRTLFVDSGATAKDLIESCPVKPAICYRARRSLMDKGLLYEKSRGLLMLAEL